MTMTLTVPGLDLDLERRPGHDLDLERPLGREVGIDRRLRVAASRGRLSTYGNRRFPGPASHRQSSGSASSSSAVAGRSSNVRRRSVAPPTWSSLSRRAPPSSRCRAAASQSAGKLRRDADSGTGLDRTSSSSDAEVDENEDGVSKKEGGVDENEGGVGEPATRGKLMLPGMRWSSGMVGDGRTRGMLMTLFLRRTRRDWDRFSAVGGLRIGAVPAGGSCGGVTGLSLDGCTGGTSSMLGVDDWIGDTPAVGDVVARGMDGARLGRRWDLGRVRPVAQHARD